MIEESDSEYEEDSYDASDDKNYIPAANSDTGTPVDSDIKQEINDHRARRKIRLR